MSIDSHKKRVYDCLAYKGYDRIPIKHCGTNEIDAELFKYFGVNDNDGMLEKIGDDFRGVSPIYKGPELKKYPDGSWEGEWGERYKNVDFGKGVYPEAFFLPFKDVTDVSE